MVKRLWSKDESLWGGPGVPEIGDRLGWLTITRQDARARRRAPGVRRVGASADGFTDVALLGMGGSSLGPEVIRRSFGEIPGGLRLHVLDSTDPERGARPRALASTWSTRCSSSPRSRAGRSRRSRTCATSSSAAGATAAASWWSPIPGSPLVDTAQELGFRRVFENDPNIGGRYSVLSYFGLVPAALAGVSVEALLGAAQVAEQNCASSGDTSANSGPLAGHRDGRAGAPGPRQAHLRRVRRRSRASASGPSSWSPSPPASRARASCRWRTSRSATRSPTATTALFVYLRNADEPDEDARRAGGGAGRAGHPTITLDGARGGRPRAGSSSSPSSRPRWPAGCSASTRSTSPTCRRPRTTPPRCSRAATCPRWTPATWRELLRRPSRRTTWRSWASRRPRRRSTPRWPSCAAAIRDATKATTTFGYGPRYLHSTGPVPQGRPADRPVPASSCTTSGEDVEIPGAGYTFEHLKKRPGDRRPADPARPRPAPPCRCGWRATPRRGCETSPRRVKEALSCSSAS